MDAHVYASISRPPIDLHIRYSPFFTCWPSLSRFSSASLSLSITALTNHNAALLTACLEPMSLHPRPFSPVTGTARSVSLPVPPHCVPDTGIVIIIKHQTRQSCPVPHKTEQSPFPKISSARSILFYF